MRGERIPGAGAVVITQDNPVKSIAVVVVIATMVLVMTDGFRSPSIKKA